MYVNMCLGIVQLIGGSEPYEGHASIQQWTVCDVEITRAIQHHGRAYYGQGSG